MEDFKIQKPNQILNMVHYVTTSAVKKVYRNGIEVEKGAIITEQRILKHKELYEKYCWLWSTYPDLFLDIIKETTSKF